MLESFIGIVIFSFVAIVSFFFCQMILELSDGISVIIGIALGIVAEIIYKKIRVNKM